MYMPFKELADSLKQGSLVVYENNGVAILGAILSVGPKKHRLLNQHGSEVELQPERLVWVPGTLPANCDSKDKRCGFLKNLMQKAHELSTTVNVADIWEQVHESKSLLDASRISELYFGDKSSEHVLSALLALYADKKFFKRQRQSFEAREKDVIEELKVQEQAEKERKEAMLQTIELIRKRLSGDTSPFPGPALLHIRLIEGLALEALDGSDIKIAKDFLIHLIEELKLNLPGQHDEQAYSLLEKLGVVTKSTDLVLLRYRPRRNWHPEELSECSKINLPEIIAADLARAENKREDLTALESFSIDDESTSDMDDALSIQRNAAGYELGIHISDVASVIKLGGAVDQEASKRATSVYCPSQRINMLPEALAENLCSLVAGEKRLCFSYLVQIDHKFKITSHKILPSLITVKKRLSYDQVDEMLHNDADSSALKESLNIIYNCASAFEEMRLSAGGIKVSRRDIDVAVKQDGTVSIKEFDEDSPARSMVGEMMILANKLSAEFGMKRNLALIYRSQADPDEDPFLAASDIPSGPAHDYAVRSMLKPSLTSLTPGHHSTLGLDAYIQVTSPIRRFADLVNQRQLLAALFEKPAPYTRTQIQGIIDQTEEVLGSARTIARESKRFWLIKFLEGKKDVILTGTVTRLDLKHPLVEIDGLYITLMANMQRKPKLGERVSLRIIKIDARKDLIRLEEVKA